MKNKIFYYLIAGIISMSTGIYFGFKHKKIDDFYVLKKIAKSGNEGQREMMVDAYRAETSFFSLKSYRTRFKFNWEWFIISFIALMLLAIIIDRRNLYTQLVNFKKEDIS
ncbi:hypothetical protein [Gaetbulibacter sp. NE]|uniref:hypothetical protein n=1 Tax=Gaetbulibacter sp. NE TaxID=2982307 RepID=UPI0021D1FFEA|nr:hypothetical protein [Gaetbulibacter sp. NE]